MKVGGGAAGRVRGARRPGPGTRRVAASLILVLAFGTMASLRSPPRALAAPQSPIKHVVVIEQENHSFDNLLGSLCRRIDRQKIVRPGLGDGCDGAVNGSLSSGATIPLAKATDVVPEVSHSVESQQISIDGGKMDGFDLIGGCQSGDTPPYQCYTQFRGGPSVANVWNFALNFAVSDRTFEQKQTPSWAGHMVLVAATTDGFQGDNPKYVPGPDVPPKGPGWGCDSNKVAPWWNGEAYESVPSCVPDQEGNGPFTGPGTSPVPYVPTILDRLDNAKLSWKIYGSGGAEAPGAVGYVWAICPSFNECLGSSQRNDWVPAEDVIADASAGSLPSVSIVTPRARYSQHNGNSMLLGDDWLGQVLGSIEHGPEWDSTAVFLTWDDCGCFYDHVNPLANEPDWGIRVPMIIVSPYAKQGYTDSTPAVFASMLAYIEHTFSLPTLHPCNGALGCTDDSDVYDYANAFDYTQTPLSPIPVTSTPVPPRERAFLRTHPAPPDVT
jgi:phospholipase C